MSDEEFLARVDERIARLERLVRRSLCKCVVGMTSYTTNGCPIHGHLSTVEEILRDQQGPPPAYLRGERAPA